MIGGNKFRKNIFKPKNELNNNIWFTINFDEIEKYTGKKIYLLNTTLIDIDILIFKNFTNIQSYCISIILCLRNIEK